MSKYLQLIFDFLILLALTTPVYSQNLHFELKTVVIDAGHGGRSPGAVVEGVREKDIVLKVALKAGELIKMNHPNVKVIYTRESDKAVDLLERAAIANRNKADLFISIHANYFKNPAIAGSETYLLGLHRTEENLELAKLENSVILLEDDYETRYEGFDPNHAESYIMFELLQDEFLEQSRLFAEKTENQFKTLVKRNSRGVKQAGFLVLRQTTMPGVLIELGYLSNKNDREYMQTETGLQKYAEAIAKAFSLYKDSREAKSASVATAQNKSPHKELPAMPDTVKASALNDSLLVEDQKQSTQFQPEKPNRISELKGTWFGIQILASSKELCVNDKSFRKGTVIFYLEEGGIHKYFTAVEKDFQKTRAQLASTRIIYPDAFLVAFDDGKKTDVNLARKKGKSF